MAKVEIHIVGFSAKLKKAVNEGISSLNKMRAKVRQHEASLKSARLKSGIALTAEILLVRNLVQAYEKQEQADIRLAQAMKNRGTYTEESYQKVKAYADELQRLTTSGNEQVQGVQTQLISIGQMEGELLNQITKASLDLAAGMKDSGMTVEVAGSLLAKSIGSTTNALTRYGINIKEGVTDPSERAALFLDIITKKFGGQAEAAAQGTGQLKQLANIWGDLKEDLGEAILPLIAKLSKYLKETLPHIRNFVQENKNLIMILVGGGVGGTALILALSQFALIFMNPATGWIAGIGFAALAIASLVAWMGKLADSTREVPDSIKGLDKAIDTTKKEIDELAELQAQMLSPDYTPGAYEDFAGDLERIKDKAFVLQSYLAELYDARAKLAGQGAAGMEAPPVSIDMDLADPKAIDQYIADLGNYVKRMAEQRVKLAEEANNIQVVPSEERTEEQKQRFAELANAIRMHTDNITTAQEQLQATYEELEARGLSISAIISPPDMSEIEEQWIELHDLLETEFENQLMQYEEYYSELDTLQEEHEAKMSGLTVEGLRRRTALAQSAGQELFNIWNTIFARIFTARMRFDKAVLAATIDSLISMFQMLIDVGVQEIMAEKIKFTALLLMKGAFDWSALAKIALVAAAAGAAKGALESMKSSAVGKISGGRYKYAGILPETGWFYGERGERVFNPAEPMASVANVGGGASAMEVHWHQHAPISSRTDAEDAFREFGNDLFYRQMGRRMATI